MKAPDSPAHFALHLLSAGPRAILASAIVRPFVALLLVAAAYAAVSEVAAASVRPPNIVFILADDLGINDLACYGRRDHRTPNLDRLAAEGTRFTSAYCAQSICSPSRAAINSGRAPARLHLTTYLPGRPDCASQKLAHPTIRMELPLEEKTIAEYLRSAGYATGLIGKWHLGNKGFLPTDQGFDVYYPGRAVTTPSATEGSKGEYELTREAIRFMTEKKDRPFFLYLGHNTPHIPYAALEERIAQNREAVEPVYAAVIEQMDEVVGLLLRSIADLGLAENTLVIFTSDNGGLHVPEGKHKLVTHNTPFRAGKGYLYEGGLRIPLIVRWPGKVPAGRVVEGPVINTDWLPTLLEVAGAPVPASGLDGISIAPVLRGAAPDARRTHYFHFPHYNNQGGKPSGAVREGAWKLIEFYEDGALELYDLSKDPGETVNLAAAQPDIARRLREQLAAWRLSVGAQSNTPNRNYRPELHKRIYLDFDSSRFNAASADAAARERVLDWRKEMDAVLPARSASKKATAKGKNL